MEAFSANDHVEVVTRGYRDACVFVDSEKRVWFHDGYVQDGVESVVRFHEAGLERQPVGCVHGQGNEAALLRFFGHM